jgi:hypothetical protein
MNNQDQEITIIEIKNKFISEFTFLKSKFKILLFTSMLGAFIGLSYIYLKPIKYTAQLTFALEDDKGVAGAGLSGISGAAGIASQFGIDLGNGGGGAFTGLNLLEVMKSKNLVFKTLLCKINYKSKNLRLIDYYIQTEGVYDSWYKKNYIIITNQFLFPLDQKRESFTFTQDSLLQKIYIKIMEDNLSVYQKDKKIGILSIGVTSKNELFAKLFAENLANEVSRYYIEIKTRKARKNVEILQIQADSIKNELSKSITKTAYATDQIYNLNLALNVNGAPIKKNQIDVQSNTVILTQLLANLEISKITLRKETPLIQIIDSPFLPLDSDKSRRLIALLSGALVSLFLTCVYLYIIRLLKINF